MARYYDLDKLSKLIEAKADTMLEGKDAMLYVAKWLNLLPTADVAPIADTVRKMQKRLEELYTDEVITDDMTVAIGVIKQNIKDVAKEILGEEK